MQLSSSGGIHRCAIGACIRSNFKVGINWHFLAIFGYFWDWECYQIDENICQTSYISKNHQWKYKMLMYHWYNSNFLSWNGWILVFWKLIGEVPYTHFFKNGLKWSHIYVEETWVNGNLLEPFMTCNNFCHSLCWG